MFKFEGDSISSFGEIRFQKFQLFTGLRTIYYAHICHLLCSCLIYFFVDFTYGKLKLQQEFNCTDPWRNSDVSSADYIINDTIM